MAMPRASASAGDLRRSGLPSKQQFARGQLVDAGEHLHQRRLACAVLADDGVDLACAEREVDVLDRRNAAECLGRAPEFEDRAHDGALPLGRRGRSRRSGPSPLAATKSVLADLAAGGDAVHRAVGPAVEARERAHRGTAAGDQPVGPARRPGLQHIELLARPALDRLEEACAARQRRRNPEGWIDGLDHAPAVVVLAQDELDQLIARREQGKPEAAVMRAARCAQDRREGRKAAARARRLSQCRARSPDAATPPRGEAGRRSRAQVRLGKQGLRRAAAARNRRRERSMSQTAPLAPRSIRSRFQSAAVTAAAPLATTSRFGSRKSPAVGQVKAASARGFDHPARVRAFGDQHAAPVEADRETVCRVPRR